MDQGRKWKLLFMEADEFKSSSASFSSQTDYKWQSSQNSEIIHQTLVVLNVEVRTCVSHIKGIIWDFFEAHLFHFCCWEKDVGINEVQIRCYCVNMNFYSLRKDQYSTVRAHKFKILMHLSVIIDYLWLFMTFMTNSTYWFVMSWEWHSKISCLWCMYKLHGQILLILPLSIIVFELD